MATMEPCRCGVPECSGLGNPQRPGEWFDGPADLRAVPGLRVGADGHVEGITPTLTDCHSVPSQRDGSADYTTDVYCAACAIGGGDHHPDCRSVTARWVESRAYKPRHRRPGSAVTNERDTAIRRLTEGTR